MTRFRFLSSSCLLAASAVALAQPPAPPAPPVPPAIPAIPVPAVAPLAIPLSDWDAAPYRVDLEAARAAVDMARDQVRDFDMDAVREQARAAREAVRAEQEQMRTAMRIDTRDLLSYQVAPAAGVRAPTTLRTLSPAYLAGADTLYDRGIRSLDRHAYDEALDDFTQAASRGSSRSDGALYWKAYALDKLGRRDDALKAIADLRKNYASSRWLDDAKALEIQVKQDAGQKVSPESESDEELKLLALNGLVQSDPDRAYPYLEKMLKGAQSPRVKRNAIFVLAESNSPKFRQLLEQVARGGANPDLQVTAIQYLGRKKSPGLLMEIYNSTQDASVKRAVLNALGDDRAAILQIAKSEKNPELRLAAIQRMGRPGDQAEIWQMYQNEQDPNVKRQLLSMLSGNQEKLLEVARNDKDMNLRRQAISMLGSVRNQPSSSDALVQLYSTGQDAQMKRAIINSLAGQRNVQGLIAIARKETDPDMKREVVRRIVETHSPEATQFMEEILK